VLRGRDVELVPIQEAPAEASYCYRRRHSACQRLGADHRGVLLEVAFRLPARTAGVIGMELYEHPC